MSLKVPTLGYPGQSYILLYTGLPWAIIETQIDPGYPMSPKANDRKPFSSFDKTFTKQKNQMKIGHGKIGQKNQQILAMATEISCLWLFEKYFAYITHTSKDPP